MWVSYGGSAPWGVNCTVTRTTACQALRPVSVYISLICLQTTFTLSLGGDKALCFPVALKCLNTTRKQENIRVCPKQKGLRRLSTRRNTNTKAWRLLVKYEKQNTSTGGRNAELVCLQGLLTPQCLMSSLENDFLTASICNACF